MKPDLPKSWGLCWCRWCKPTRAKKFRRLIHKRVRARERAVVRQDAE